jgi:ElaB/YqjD/DUF883 family membrane-anchored ribosome-binding protein
MTEGKQPGEAQRTPEEIERDIQATRERLGDTVTAVADKADVKKQAHQKVDEAQSLARENPVPIGMAGAFLACLVVGRVLTRR